MQTVSLARSTRCVVLLGVLAGVGTRTVAAQDVALSSRAPRFLVAASARGAAVEVDPSGNALLRQVVSLNLVQPTVGRLLVAIERQTGLRFGYSVDVLPVDRMVALRADTITVGAALLSILMDTGFDVLLSGGRQMTLVQRSRRPRSAPSGTISGRVIAQETKAPLVGASVTLTLPDTALHTVTGDSGAFLLANVPPGDHKVTVRYIGYKPLTKTVAVDTAAVHITFALEVVATKLDELISNGASHVRRRDIGNAITTINADSVLQTAPIRSLTDLLDNRVPGMTLQHSTGAPGDPARIRLRGLSSVLRSNDPVVIVDGVRIYAAQSEQRSGNLTNFVNRTGVTTPAPSPLDQIDPNIIEKIEVFKGPSAATMYGPDAANGVIVVTTKKGHPGPTRWNASFTEGLTVPSGQYPQGYYRFGHIPFFGGFTTFCALADARCVPDSLVRFQALNDPEFSVLGQGRRTALSLTASGGTQALTYSVTGSYADEIGLLTLPPFEVRRFDSTFQRAVPDWMLRPHHLMTWNVTSSLTAILSRTADVTLTTTLGRDQQQRTSLEDQLPALAGTYVDRASGVYYTPGNTVQNGPGLVYVLSPNEAPLKSYYELTTASAINFTTALNASWRPKAWFNASGQAGLNVIPRDDRYLLPPKLTSATDPGVFSRATGRSLVSTFNVQGALRKPLRWGFVFETSAGANIATNNTSDLASQAVGLVPGTTSLIGAADVTTTENWSNSSIYGWYLEPRISGQRFALSTGLRLDGGSAYGTRLTGNANASNPFHFRDLINPAQLFGLRSLLGNLLTLPKLNGSWVISEEPWFPFRALFSSLRLRGAYGQAQQQPGIADGWRLYQPALGDQLHLLSVGNTHLRPERSVEFEGGFDADLLDSRATLEVTAYHKMQKDMLMTLNLPGSVDGGGSVLTNIGNVLNTGLELTLGLTPVRLPALTWSAQLNFSRNTNKLVTLAAGVDPNPRNGLVAGYPLDSRWALPIVGFADANGNGTLQADEVQVGDSLVYMGRLYPDYQTSLNTNVALFGGAVGITASFSYVAGQTQIDQTAARNWVLARPLVDPSTSRVEQASVLVYDKTTYGLTRDVSTFRFNTLSVNYRAPARVSRLLGAQQLTVALQGANLGLHSTYNGKDPDVNAWSPGEKIIDTGQLAQPRTWQLAVFLQY